VSPKPKKKCCVSKPRCQSCPLRLLAEGRLPEGYTVKRRRLVKVTDEAGGSSLARVLLQGGKKGKGGKGKKAGKGKKQKVVAAA
jgi:hypothetical protein